MKIKIARIITRMDLGGAQQAVLALCRDLDPSVFQQILITGEGGLLFPELSKITKLKYYAVPELTRSLGMMSFWNDLQAVFRIRAILRKERPHIVHTHTPKAGILGRWAGWLAGIPVIVHTYHGFGFGDSHPCWKKVLYIYIERLTGNITNWTVAVSEKNRAKGIALGFIKRDRSTVIRSGIDTSRFRANAGSRPQKKIEMQLSTSDRIVGIVAGFKPPKALFYFLEIAYRVSRQVPGITFLMVGDGELRPQIEARIRSLQIERVVRLLGWRTDIDELLPLFDVFLLTSMWEGLPRVAVEAVLAKVPVVAFDVDGVSEVVRNGENGYLVAPGDVDSMTSRVMALLKEDHLRQNIDKSIDALTEEFSIQKMLGRHSSLYVELVQEWKKLAQH